MIDVEVTETRNSVRRKMKNLAASTSRPNIKYVIIEYRMMGMILRAIKSVVI